MTTALTAAPQGWFRRAALSLTLVGGGLLYQYRAIRARAAAAEARLRGQIEETEARLLLRTDQAQTALEARIDDSRRDVLAQLGAARAELGAQIDARHDAHDARLTQLNEAVREIHASTAATERTVRANRAAIRQLLMALNLPAPAATGARASLGERLDGDDDPHGLAKASLLRRRD